MEMNGMGWDLEDIVLYCIILHYIALYSIVDAEC